MAYRYQIKKGHEGREFANSHRTAENTIESDDELNSIYLTPILEEAQNAEAQEKPVEPQRPVAPVQPVQPQPAQSENKEASK